MKNTILFFSLCLFFACGEEKLDFNEYNDQANASTGKVEFLENKLTSSDLDQLLVLSHFSAHDFVWNKDKYYSENLFSNMSIEFDNFGQRTSLRFKYSDAKRVKKKKHWYSSKKAEPKKFLTNNTISIDIESLDATGMKERSFMYHVKFSDQDRELVNANGINFFKDVLQDSLITQIENDLDSRSDVSGIGNEEWLDPEPGYDEDNIDMLHALSQLKVSDLVWRDNHYFGIYERAQVAIAMHSNEDEEILNFYVSDDSSLKDYVPINFSKTKKQVEQNQVGINFHYLTDGKYRRFPHGRLFELSDYELKELNALFARNSTTNMNEYFHLFSNLIIGKIHEEIGSSLNDDPFEPDIILKERPSYEDWIKNNPDGNVSEYTELYYSSEEARNEHYYDDLEN